MDFNIIYPWHHEEVAKVHGSDSVRKLGAGLTITPQVEFVRQSLREWADAKKCWQIKLRAPAVSDSIPFLAIILSTLLNAKNLETIGYR